MTFPAARRMTETNVTVLRPRTPELFGAADQHVENMKRTRDAAVMAAAAARDRAEAAIETANRQANAARAAKAEAEAELRRLMERGELFIVGDTAIELNDHGGLHIRRARVVGLV